MVQLMIINGKMREKKKIQKDKNIPGYPVVGTLHRICVNLDITAVPVPTMGPFSHQDVSYVLPFVYKK
jgi:hypothetical protein